MNNDKNDNQQHLSIYTNCILIESSRRALQFKSKRFTTAADNDDDHHHQPSSTSSTRYNMLIDFVDSLCFKNNNNNTNKTNDPHRLRQFGITQYWSSSTSSFDQYNPSGVVKRHLPHFTSNPHRLTSIRSLLILLIPNPPSEEVGDDGDDDDNHHNNYNDNDHHPSSTFVDSDIVSRYTLYTTHPSGVVYPTLPPEGLLLLLLLLLFVIISISIVSNDYIHRLRVNKYHFINNPHRLRRFDHYWRYSFMIYPPPGVVYPTYLILLLLILF